MLAISIILLGILSRLVIHAPNFTPVMALALFGGVYLPRRQALFVPVILMVISDLLLGAHQTMLFTWGSVILISALGIYLRSKMSWRNVLGGSLISALVFFVITNFGAWLVMYPRTVDGFVNCYVAAIPFFRMTLASTLLYTVICFGVYQVVARWVKETRWSKVMLNA